MARSNSGYYNAIEYVGPRPQKPKKPSMMGGWFIVAIAIGSSIFFGKTFIDDALAADKEPTSAQTELVISELEQSPDFGSRLAVEALKYSERDVSYDHSYFKIDYPNGDIPSGKGVAADLVIRCYRELGVDLQALLHEDMESSFRDYPQLWNALDPDSNIDHRRVPNLHKFFDRMGEPLSTEHRSGDFETGDIVIWALGNAEMHIGIVVPSPDGLNSDPWVVHHPANEEVKWENDLSNFQIFGHYRYDGGQ